jgi:minor extracellular serine protease Vpr
MQSIFNGPGRKANFFRQLGTAAIAVILTVGSATAGAAGRTPRAISGGQLHNFKPAMLPRAMSTRPATFILELKGDPVTVAAAKSPNFGAREKVSLREQLRAAQQRVGDKVNALGGKVLSGYQLAYNGLRVQAPARSYAQLAAIPGVVAVHRAEVFKRDNVHGVPLVGGPQVWGGVPGLRGEGIKIADIDTGIDYTHADFGGPGTVEAYQAALATDTASPDPTLVGPTAPKVKGGTDLAGDDYNADPTSDTYQPVPHPDDNPLDCGSHGTHTAGTMAGFGVTADGYTFNGPYDAGTIASHSWKVGPGVAPKADLYAVRVFGCDGSTDLVVDAIEWAVANDMDVINMSLGSPFGSTGDPSAVASTNAAAAGIIIVTSAGNSGGLPYITGSPGTSRGVVSTAATDPISGFPGARINLSTGKNPPGINANGVQAGGVTLPLRVVYSGTPHDAAHISIGCDPQEYVDAGVAGAVAVIKRGTCARVAKAIFGQQAGAAAVLMINNADTLPPFEGAITGNPDDGTPYDVTIPFVGVANRHAANIVAADGGTATLKDLPLMDNPAFLEPTTFSSGGPRTGNSGMKPDLIAPGQNIYSAGMGTGDNSLILSGTSMAAPHATGAAALVKQAHQGWRKSAFWRAALVNTADPTLAAKHDARLAGAGLLQAQNATLTDVVALGDSATPELSFGFNELAADFSATHSILLKNLGHTPATFDTSVIQGGHPHTAGVSATSVTVPANGGTATIDFTLDVAAATAGTAPDFTDVTGIVVFTPTGGSNHGVTLRVPYLMVPQALSNVHTQIDTSALAANGSADATTTNVGGVVPGTADWYAWGLSDELERENGAADLRAAGVQSFPGFVVFAIKTGQRWSNAANTEIDVDIDVDRDGEDDYVVANVDLGAITTGSYSGQPAVLVVNLATGGLDIQFFTDAPTDSSTMTLPVLVDQLCQEGSPCLSASNPRFTYHVESFGWNGEFDEMTRRAGYNAFSPAVENALFDTVHPDATVHNTVHFDAAEAKKTPPLGLMIVTHENTSRGREAQLIRIPQ